MYQALQEVVEANQVLWLVDGLDETHGWQPKVAAQVSRLPGRVILTSRLVGYQRSSLETWPHFEVLPLAPANVEQFLRDWLGLLAERQGHTPDWVEREWPR